MNTVANLVRRDSGAPTTAAYSITRAAKKHARSVTSHAPGIASLLRSLLKNCAMFLYRYGGYVALRDIVLSVIGRSRVVVVYYHRIGSPDILTKSTGEFVRDLKHYKRNYQVMPLSELCHRLKSRQRFRRRSIAITFDDGYRDNFTSAVPALQSAGLPATFFVATGFVGTDQEFQHDQAARPGSHETKSAFYPKLTWSDLREMQAMGFEIGSHTVNHVNLGHASPREAGTEVVESLNTLNRELGTRPRPFSFPWGKPQDISPSAIDAVEKAGYYSAASAYGGANTTGGDAFNLKRIDVGNGNLGRLTFKAKVAGLDPDYIRMKFCGKRISRSKKTGSDELEVPLND